MKRFYTFGHSAHSPLFEVPEIFGQILRDEVLTTSITRADMIVPVDGQRKPLYGTGLNVTNRLSASQLESSHWL